jgi:hypothetical protein
MKIELHGFQGQAETRGSGKTGALPGRAFSGGGLLCTAHAAPSDRLLPHAKFRRIFALMREIIMIFVIDSINAIFR